MRIETEIIPDEFTKRVSVAFDYEFDGKSFFTLPSFTKPENDFHLGVIVGSSGSGKSQILKHHFWHEEPLVDWSSQKAIVSHFETPEIALERLFASGLSSIPTLCKPYYVLSNGEKYRAYVARILGDGCIIDEFTSVVNRETAKSLSVSLSKYIRRKNLRNVVLSSCHRDILDWLEPDWVFDCDSNEIYKQNVQANLKRVMKIEIY
jgi:hypothetical protein